jgi:hypothetical protein
MPEKKPHEIIRDLAAERAERSDDEVLAEIERIPPIADEGDAAWNEPTYWSIAYRYVALSDVAAGRKLRPAVRLLLERACNGDPGEMMRGMRHSFEAIFAPDWRALAEVCMDLCASERVGTRMWATHQLMILDDPRAKPILERALDDDNAEVRHAAAAGLEKLARIAG